MVPLYGDVVLIRIDTVNGVMQGAEVNKFQTETMEYLEKWGWMSKK